MRDDDTPRTVLSRHRTRLLELRAASRKARREHAPKGNALVGHLRFEREVTADLLATESAVTCTRVDRVDALAMLEAVALASRSHAAAQQAEAARRALEAEQVEAIGTLGELVSQAPAEVKRHLLRVLEQDLAPVAQLYGNR
jgi:hypothetical protein